MASSSSSSSKEIFIPLTSRIIIFYRGIHIDNNTFSKEILPYLNESDKEKLSDGKTLKKRTTRLLKNAKLGEYITVDLHLWKQTDNDVSQYILGRNDKESLTFHAAFAKPSMLSQGDWAGIHWSSVENCFYVRIIHQHFYFREPRVITPAVNLQSLLKATTFAQDTKIREEQMWWKSWLVHDIEGREYSGLDNKWQVIKYLGMVDSLDGLYVQLNTYLDMVPCGMTKKFLEDINKGGFRIWVQNSDEGTQSPLIEGTVVCSPIDADYVIIKFERKFDLTMSWIEGSVVGLNWISHTHLSYSLLSHAKYWSKGSCGRISTLAA